jgi:nucleoside-diphosphate-sugar epimerase
VKILVTGAAGYIGGWLVNELKSRGHDVAAQDIEFSEGNRDFDLGDANLRRRWLLEEEPEVVVHLAALYGRVWGDVDMMKTAAVNAGLTGELARDVAACGARLLYVSSSEVYGVAADNGVTVGPSTVLRPRNMYGLSKKWGEEAAEAYAPDGLMITRLNMPYGPAFTSPVAGTIPSVSGKPGLIGYNMLHSMLWQAAHGYDLKVHAGTTRCLTWVGDTVRGLTMIAEAGQSGTWNVNRDDDHRPVADIADAVIELTGSTSQIIVTEPPERVTLHKHLSNRELLKLGWVPRTSFEDGMLRCYEYYRRFDRDGIWQG